MPSNMALVMQACSVSNPFCPEAVGARWPDNSMTKSAAFTYRNSMLLTTNAAGLLSSAYMASSAPAVATATVAGTTASYGGNWAVFSGIAGSASTTRFRVTSIGYKISCTSPRLSTQGRLRLRIFSPLETSTLVSFEINTQYVDSVYDVPLARLIDKDVYVTPAPLGDIARIFRDSAEYIVTDPVASAPNPGWQILVVSVDGMTANTACVSVEVFAHYEYVYGDGATTAQFATAPPRSNMAVREANASVVEKIGGVVEGTASYLDRLSKSAAAKYLGGAAAYLLGGPAAAAGAYGALAIKDVD